MFIDARTIPAGQRLETDICIIGAGAAGITLAREFAGQPFRVALLAGGGLEVSPDAQSLNSGPNTGLPYFDLAYCRARFFGGSTAWWGGHCRPLSDFDFEAKEWIPLSGWPIRKKDIADYYARAEQICHLRSHEWDPQSWASKYRLSQLPLDTGLLETRVAQLIHPTALRRFGTVYREEVKSAANVTTYLNANVTEIETDYTGKNVTGLQLACISGPKFSLAVKKICILATGGLENPRLLLVSNRVQKNGLGNQHDLVGRYFLEHPRFDAGVFRPSSLHPPVGIYGEQHLKDGIAIKSYIGTTPKLMRSERISDVQLRVENVYDPAYTRAMNSRGVASLQRMGAQLRRKKVPDHFGDNVMRVATDIDNVVSAAYWWMFVRGSVRQMSVVTRVEPFPNPDSRVRLIEDRDALGVPRITLDWRLSPEDKRSARRAMEVFANEVGRTGSGRVQILFEDDGDARNFPPSLEGGWHHMGTTRMADDPKLGVVDRECRVHGMSNLWLAGSSVFPTAGSGTPTMLLIALALRLADQVKQRMA